MVKPPKSEKPKKGKNAPQAQPEIRYPRRTERRLRTRAKILQAADDHFRKEGYGATTMQTIADTADIHVTTLFMHFNTKSDLALGLVQADIDGLHTRATEARGQVSFPDFFRSEALRRAGLLSTAPRPGLTLWNALHSDGDLAFALSKYDADQANIFARFAAEDLKLDREQDFRADLIAALLTTAVDLAHRKWVDSGGTLDLAREISNALDMAEPAALKLIEG